MATASAAGAVRVHRRLAHAALALRSEIDWCLLAFSIASVPSSSFPHFLVFSPSPSLPLEALTLFIIQLTAARCLCRGRNRALMISAVPIYLAFAALSPLVAGHACEQWAGHGGKRIYTHSRFVAIWTPAMLGYNVTAQTYSYDNRPVVPLYNMPFSQWWMVGVMIHLVLAWI
jgi:hypothetical protein